MAAGNSPEGDRREDAKPSRQLGKDGERYYDYSSLEGNFADNYARQYYLESREVPSDEYIVADHLIPFLRANHQGGVFLDPATGPTVHHELLVSPYFSQLHCADFLSDNRLAVKAFVENDLDALVEDDPYAQFVGAPFPFLSPLRWDHYAKFYLERHGAPADSEAIKALLAATRSKIGANIVKSNLMQFPVVDTPILYDAAGCFYCLEEVAKSDEDLAEIVKNVSQHIRPGGAFMASCLAESDFYLLEQEDGEKINIPCLYMDEARLRNAVEAAGLEIPYGGITLKQTEGQAEEGLPGILVVYAQKPFETDR